MSEKHPELSTGGPVPMALRPMPWKCPACGHQQVSTTPGLNCEHCGGGQPGKHVGKDFSRLDVAGTKGREGSPDLEEALRPLVEPQTYDDQRPPDPSPEIDQAFLAWIKPVRGQHGPAAETLMYVAFKAGALWAAMRVPQTGTPLTGTAESRTIIAALKFFHENVLSQQPEEVTSGEWLSLKETAELIQRLERSQ